MTKRAFIPLPPLDYLQACFELDVHRGLLIWRVRPREHFVSDKAHSTWNGRYPGTVAGSIKPTGYRIVAVNGVQFKCSRLVYSLATQTDPGDAFVDHINQNKADDRPENLRVLTRAQNMLNITPANTGAASGCRGVSLHNGKWRARIRAHGSEVFLGNFATQEEAAAAYTAAKLVLLPRP